jgi:hypothetical protein
MCAFVFKLVAYTHFLRTDLCVHGDTHWHNHSIVAYSPYEIIFTTCQRRNVPPRRRPRKQMTVRFAFKQTFRKWVHFAAVAPSKKQSRLDNFVAKPATQTMLSALLTEPSWTKALQLEMNKAYFTKVRRYVHCIRMICHSDQRAAIQRIRQWCANISTEKPYFQRVCVHATQRSQGGHNRSGSVP